MNSESSPSLPLDFKNDTWQRRVTWLRRWLAMGGLLLITATWRLWIPQELFPQVPFIAALQTAPAWLDWLSLAGLFGGLSGLLAAPSRSQRAIRTAAVIFGVSLVLAALLDQHRFQPWAYEFALLTLVLTFAAPARAASLLRLLVVGLYFWSAVSKIDYSFLHGIGPDLLRGMLTAIGLDPRQINPNSWTMLSWCFPIGELFVALLLAIRRTRTIGLVLSILMHVALLVTLGPWGLNHEWGVLLWNLYFIGQNLLLFWRPSTGWRATADGSDLRSRIGRLFERNESTRRTIGIEHAAVAFAVGLPILEPFGLLDHWPAWAVYAPGAERVTLLVHVSAVEKLPSEIQQHLGPPDFLTESRILRTDLWSLDALSAPIYPQGRFRTGVALAVAQRFEFGNTATLVVESRANRQTGERTQTTFQGTAAIEQFADSFWFNARPRKLGGW